MLMEQQIDHTKSVSDINLVNVASAENLGIDSEPNSAERCDVFDMSAIKRRNQNQMFREANENEEVKT